MNHLETRLDYARDCLLLKIAHTLLHMPFNCSPTGAQMLRRDLETSADVFQLDLEAMYPDKEETQS